MFEQSVLTNAPAGKRVWATMLGVTSQVALVSFAVMAPMVFPQVLPTARILETLAPPLPPAPKPLGEQRRGPASTTHVLPRVLVDLTHYQPTSVPKGIPTIIEEPDPGGVVGTLPGIGGPDTGVVGAILQDMARAVVRPPGAAPKPIVKPAEAAPALPARYRVGGNVRLGTLLHRVEPQYPQIAKAARVQGDVELECVVGIDGHIKEVKVTSGSPFLVQAAKDAAWQWVYSPSQLNGLPIEIVTILKFSFRLN